MTMSGRPSCSATSKTVTTVGRRGKTRRRERLPPEARACVVLLRVPVREQLDSNRPLEGGVGRAIHLAHPSPSDEIRRRHTSSEAHRERSVWLYPISPRFDTACQGL